MPDAHIDVHMHTFTNARWLLTKFHPFFFSLLIIINIVLASLGQRQKTAFHLNLCVCVCVCVCLCSYWY